jgi:RNA polymerase sigma-70 factor, ECF subfamily
MIGRTPEPSSSAIDDYAQSRDLDLLKCISSRDRDAIGMLYMRYHSRLTKFFACLTLHPRLIDQMLEDIFVIVWQCAGSFNTADRVSTWIASLAYRRALRSMHDDQWAFEDWRVNATRTDDDIGNALACLPVGQRALLAMIYCLGCSSGEVATILQWRVGEVDLQIQRAHARLRNCKRQCRT